MKRCLWCGEEIAEPEENVKEEITPSEYSQEAREANEAAFRDEEEYVKAFCRAVGITYDRERICAECWAPMGELGANPPEESRRPDIPRLTIEDVTGIPREDLRFEDLV